MNKRGVYFCVIDLFVFPDIIDLFLRGEGDTSPTAFQLYLSAFRNQNYYMHISSKWGPKVQKNRNIIVRSNVV